MLSTLKRLTLATAALAFAAHAAAADLTLDVYNPGEAAIFPVSSVLVIAVLLGLGPARS